MNRPRNRQPRAPRGDSSNRSGGRGTNKASSGPPRWTPGTPQQASGTVPTIRQVVPGASVFIILKEDQATGRETAGVVQDLLTRGDHPRGIKVRLRGGQVGRVQRMGTDAEGGAWAQSSATAQGGSAAAGGRGGRIQHKYRDVRLEDEVDEPPERSLADYLPAGFGDAPAGTTSHGGTLPNEPTTTVKCPICEDFEGDEVAVSYHVEQHLQ